MTAPGSSRISYTHRLRVPEEDECPNGGAHPHHRVLLLPAVPLIPRFSGARCAFGAPDVLETPGPDAPALPAPR
ncbi:hypothetical protein GCM10007147_04610 [Nocardiopsis kunsanensis]|uniref:Uncharacterized protein n=1 Tax=Nocardiopsis kunsanensis TaxID=141693 RepID=A0A919CF11_9ACTN|nr:hypothetical protein GCM10007147_04610 [Nocardiopsis kunsanensis]